MKYILCTDVGVVYNVGGENGGKCMRIFDTKIQYLKYKVLKEVARRAWNEELLETIVDIPKKIIQGEAATMRCCVYKERAIISERVKIAMGGDPENKNVIEVIDIACDECPMGGYEVTDSCRGCLAHRCEDVCKKEAITFDEHQKATIDKSKCVNCGACAKVCPYSAIANRKRPCENACKVKAIGTREDGAASIDNSKCLSCGACVYQCPWGAIVDKSFILDVISILKEKKKNPEQKIYAMVAPSYASQFSYAKTGQVVKGILELGFTDVVEAARGADFVASLETKELVEKGLLTSSCCPAFVKYVTNQYPDLLPHVSHNLSPMAALGKYIKEKDPTAKIVFIGPCTAKKMEFQKEEVRPYIDSVITFEELQALFDSRYIEIVELEEVELDEATFFGRIFARSGGLSDAIVEGLKELGEEDFSFNPVVCSGIDACRLALLKLSKNALPGNFIEGMACEGGCIGGAGCLTHGEKNKVAVDHYGKLATDETILGVVKKMK